MLRSFLCSVAALAIFMGGLAPAQDEVKKDEPRKATITKVDAAKKTITLKLTDKDGKEVERTFQLEGDVKLHDAGGKAVQIDHFRIGNIVLTVQRQGKVTEMRIFTPDKEPEKKSGDK